MSELYGRLGKDKFSNFSPYANFSYLDPEEIKAKTVPEHFYHHLTKDPNELISIMTKSEVKNVLDKISNLFAGDESILHAKDLE